MAMNMKRPMPTQAKVPAAAAKGMAMRAATTRGKSATAPGRVKAPGTPAMPAAKTAAMAAKAARPAMPTPRPMPTQARVPAAAAKGMAMRSMPRGR